LSNRLAVPCCLAVLEIAWLTPWSYLIGATATGTPLLPPWAMFVILVAAAGITARFVDQEEPSARSRIVQVALGVAVAIAASRLAPGATAGWPASLLAEAVAIPTHGLSSPLLALLGAAGLWQQGILLGRGRAGDRGVGLRVSIGVAGLAGAALVSRSSAPALEQTVLPLAVIAFLLAALLASTLADLEAVRSGSQDRQARALSRSWLGLVAGTACGLLVIGLAVAGLAERQGLRALQFVASVLLPVVDVLGLIIAIPFAFAADLLFHLIQLFRGRQQAPPKSQPAKSPLAHLQQSGTSAPPPEWLTHLIGIVAAVLVLLVVIALLWVAMRRFRGLPPEADVLEERRSIWSWADLMASFRRRRPADSILPAEGPVDAVRAAYRQFLTLAAQAGHPRQRAETPLEYDRRLDAEFPIDGAASAELTGRYHTVRYGPHGATEADAAAARAALARWRQGLPENTAAAGERSP
jgi:Domain of unknown function (DUF4129)